MTWEVRQGHVLELLKATPTEHVHCVVTSPPYWGLRSYKTEPQVWGGEAEHAHKWGDELPDPHKSGLSVGGHLGADRLGAGRDTAQGKTAGCVCLCGTWRGELGLEPTPELYVQHLVEVFREVRRVLRKDGTLWLNMADCYAGSAQSWSKSKVYAGAKQATNKGSITRSWIEDYGYSRPPGYISSRQPNGLKPKDLVGVPWRVAFALQADGWYLRSDIIWAKPSPMPESVTDRPTKSHEYVFLLTKSAKYFFDQEAVRAPISQSTENCYEYGWAGVTGNASQDMELGKRVGNLFQEAKATGKPFKDILNNPTRRNIRSVWHIPTFGFPEAHFATFPEKLVEPCIRAGTSEKGCCANCGAPWKRVIRKSGGTIGRGWHDHQDDLHRGQQSNPAMSDGTYQVETLGWHPTCSCQASTFPCTVLDPFAGSGTTGVVALKLGRNFLGIELNPEYVAMAKRRIGAVMPLFDRWG